VERAGENPASPFLFIFIAAEYQVSIGFFNCLPKMPHVIFVVFLVIEKSMEMMIVKNS